MNVDFDGHHDNCIIQCSTGTEVVYCSACSSVYFGMLLVLVVVLVVVYFGMLSPLIGLWIFMGISDLYHNC